MIISLSLSLFVAENENAIQNAGTRVCRQGLCTEVIRNTFLMNTALVYIHTACGRWSWCEQYSHPRKLIDSSTHVQEDNIVTSQTVIAFYTRRTTLLPPTVRNPLERPPDQAP